MLLFCLLSLISPDYRDSSVFATLWGVYVCLSLSLAPVIKSVWTSVRLFPHPSPTPELYTINFLSPLSRLFPSRHLTMFRFQFRPIYMESFCDVCRRLFRVKGWLLLRAREDCCSCVKWSSRLAPLRRLGISRYFRSRETLMFITNRFLPCLAGASRNISKFFLDLRSHVPTIAFVCTVPFFICDV